MQFFKYAIVTMLLLLTPVDSIMAACSDWRASDLIPPNKDIVIKYYVTLQTAKDAAYDSYLYEYPGFNKNNNHGYFSFDVHYGSSIRLALTGWANYGKKKFVLPARRDIKAFFDPGILSFENEVFGGYFSHKIWDYNPQIGRQLICVRKIGSNVLLNHEEARTFKRPATVISPHGSSGKTLESLNTGKSSDSSSTANSSLADLASNIRDSNPASSSVSKDKKKSEVIICDTTLRKRPYSFPKVPSPVTVSGLLKDEDIVETQAYWFDPSIDTSPQNREFNLDISSTTNKFVVVEIPYKKGNKSFPVRFTGIAKVQKVSAETAATTNINILVVGDASSIAISGLEQMEKILIQKRKKSHRKFSWTIDWRNIAADGKWQKSQKIKSFAELVRKAKSVSGKKVLLTEDREFINFISDFKTTVLGTEKEIDFVIWIKHGYQVPLKTPALIGELIKKIHDKGKIPRFSNGNPHKWLYILSGSMPGKSKALLEEPINRAAQHPGYVEEEKIGRTPRRLLNSPKTLANIVAMRHVTTLPEKYYLDPDKLAVDANEVFYSLGLLLSVKSIDGLLSSMNRLKNMTKYVKVFNGIYDPTVLLNIQSNSAGEPKGLVVTDKLVAANKIHWRQKNHKTEIDNFLKKATLVLKTVKRKLGTGSRSHCTHIYVKDTDMGLNWLNN
jgi:hypothetical protein